MIIKSILDTDLYKFTTSYAYMKLFPQAVGTFEFKDRDNTEYTEEFVEQLRIELYNLAQVRLTSDEFEFMNSIRFIPRHYWEWLSQFTFNPSKVQIFLDEEKHLHILVKDYLYKVTLYEVPILAMVSELRNRMLEHKVDTQLMLNKLENKIKRSNQAGIYFSEFGTRRRFSYNLTKNNLKAMVLGISGGIDSTVVAAICHEVSKKTDIPLIGRSLPIKNKDDDSQAFRLTVRLEEEVVHATLDLVEVYVQERYYNADDDYLPDDFEDEMKR